MAGGACIHVWEKVVQRGGIFQLERLIDSYCRYYYQAFTSKKGVPVCNQHFLLTNCDSRYFIMPEAMKNRSSNRPLDRGPKSKKIYQSRKNQFPKSLSTGDDTVGHASTPKPLTNLRAGDHITRPTYHNEDAKLQVPRIRIAPASTAFPIPESVSFKEARRRS